MSAATRVERATGFTLQPLGPFSLTAAAAFWGRFTPAGHPGPDAAAHLHMAFAVEGNWDTVGVCVREVDGEIHGRVYDRLGRADIDTVRQHTARILSLDVDGRGFPDVGGRDHVVADLQRRSPGLRPVCFYSTYEAAVWAILSQRIQMRQAATIKSRLRDSLGEVVDIHGQPMRAFPPPQALLDLPTVPGLFGSKPANLRAVAHAALSGDLSADALRSLSDAQALSALQALPGIGPFSAELILLRGAGRPDYLTLLEPRFRGAVEDAYQLDHTPSDAELQSISANWRPYRMWVTFLLRQARG
jgi:DNA-3-methyladenine glycosylase II